MRSHGTGEVQKRSDHFDGTRYFNPEPVEGHHLGQVLRWQLARRRTKAAWPKWIDDPVQPPPPAHFPDGSVSVTFIGHASFLLQLRQQDGAILSLLIDPVFSERCSPFRRIGPKRVRAPGLKLEQLPPIDTVLVSHNHYDHMDMASLRALQARFRPHVVTPVGNAAILARGGMPGATELDWWQHVDRAGLRITATPARHFSARGLSDRNRALWAGFMVELDGVRVLFAGDSGAGSHWKEIRDRLGPPDIALLPIGAYEPRWFMQPVHMNPQEAVLARAELEARRAIGMHFGTFQLTDEAIGQPELDLATACQQDGLTKEDFDVLLPGESRVMVVRSGRP